LRSLRWSIFHQMSRQEKVEEQIQEYHVKVKKFLRSYKTNLSKIEVKIWKSKLRNTKMAVKNYEATSEIVDVKEDLEEDKDAKVLNEVKTRVNNEDTKLQIAPQVQKSFDAVDSQESLVGHLPDVPVDENSIDECNPVDEEIEEKLLRLKFFRKTWFSSHENDTALKTVVNAKELAVAEKEECTIFFGHI
jgi:hypothetical protein